MIVDTATIVVDPDVTSAPSEASTGEKRKRRSEVWQHFTKLDKKPGEREECQCNHCGQLYACSSRSGTGHLNRHINEGRCQKFKPISPDSQTRTIHATDDLEDILGGLPSKVGQTDGLNDSTHKVIGLALLDMVELNCLLMYIVRNSILLAAPLTDARKILSEWSHN